MQLLVSTSCRFRNELLLITTDRGNSYPEPDQNSSYFNVNAPATHPAAHETVPNTVLCRYGMGPVQLRIGSCSVTPKTAYVAAELMRPL